MGGDFGEVGPEEKLQSLPCSGQRAGCYAEDYEQQDEQWNHAGGCALNAFLHALHDDDVGEDDEEDRDGTASVNAFCADEGGKGCLYVVEGAENAARYGEVQVIDAPSGHDAVETEDERSAEERQYPYDAP